VLDEPQTLNDQTKWKKHSIIVMLCISFLTSEVTGVRRLPVCKEGVFIRGEWISVVRNFGLVSALCNSLFCCSWFCDVFSTRWQQKQYQY
jgi:hypothetical protein